MSCAEGGASYPAGAHRQGQGAPRMDAAWAAHCPSPLGSDTYPLLQDGDKFLAAPECYIRGSTIKYLRDP